MYREYRIGVVVPAYDEELSIGRVVADLYTLCDCDGGALIDDLVVCNNGSQDNTAGVAKAAGARVVHEFRRGYGYACLRAIKALGAVDIVLFVDADQSVRLTEAYDLLAAIAGGADVAVGSRVLGNTESRSMTVPQRVGNVLAAWLIRRLWGHPTTDLGPFRAIRWMALRELGMSNKTYGWTVEMQVKAIQARMSVAEVPTSYQPRVGVSKISGTFRGVIGAGVGIIGTILKLYFTEDRRKIADYLQPTARPDPHI